MDTTEPIAAEIETCSSPNWTPLIRLATRPTWAHRRRWRPRHYPGRLRQDLCDRLYEFAGLPGHARRGADRARRRYDAVVTKLDPFRRAVLEYSTFLGGADNDQGNAIKVDAGGLAYAAVSRIQTTSDNSWRGPATAERARRFVLAKLSIGGNTLLSAHTSAATAKRKRMPWLWTRTATPT